MKDKSKGLPHEANLRPQTAYPGGYEVEFGRAIRSGEKVHTVQVRQGSYAIGGSGETLADAFRHVAERLDENARGGPFAPAVWGSERGEQNDG